MANRQFQNGYVIGERIIDLVGSFVPLTGAGTVLASKVTGLGFGYAPSGNPGIMTLQPRIAQSPLTSTPGILRTGTGLYTITFEDNYLEMVGVSVDLAVAAASANWAQALEPIANIASSTLAPTLSLQIINSSGTAVDSAANCRLHFFIRFRDSTTRYGKP